MAISIVYHNEYLTYYMLSFHFYCKAMTNIIQWFLIALCMTILIETVVLYLLVRRQVPIKKLLLWSIFASFSTLPYVWFIIPKIITSPIIHTTIAEIFAVFIEAYIYTHYREINYKKAIIYSLLANAASFTLWNLIILLFI